jgi:hypothetical protein
MTMLHRNNKFSCGSLERLGDKIAKWHCMRRFYLRPKLLNEHSYAIRAACAPGRLHNATYTCSEAAYSALDTRER